MNLKSKKAILHGTRVAEPIEMSAFVSVPAIGFFRPENQVSFSGRLIKHFGAATHPSIGWCPKLIYLFDFHGE